MLFNLTKCTIFMDDNKLCLLPPGGAMDEELQFMVRGSIQAQQDVTELFSIVLKQKEVIKMLVTRIRESEGKLVL